MLGFVEQNIDLDEGAVALTQRLPRWQARGLSVGDITWADGQLFDHEVTADRQRVRGDYSMGIRARRDREEGEVILYAGGWCDLEYWSGRPVDQPFAETHGWEEPLDLPAFVRVLDRFESLFDDGG
jgi:hypothetical protein